ncbi:hypothetical protein Lal_00009887 [Lupinus albus]|nr:hypothetical protein Lal_00009887 [Lupinus albus]
MPCDLKKVIGSNYGCMPCDLKKVIGSNYGCMPFDPKFPPKLNEHECMIRNCAARTTSLLEKQDLSLPRGFSKHHQHYH